MSLFDIFHSKNRDKTPTISKTAEIDTVDLALYLLSTLSIGSITPEKYKQTVENELRLCDVNNTGFPDRQTLLLRIIELAGNPDTPKQRYLLAKAYSWSHAEYRPQAIKYLNLYLNSDPYCGAYENVYIPEDKNNPSSWVSPKNQHLSEMYSALGDAYLGEYMNQEALYAYQKANEYAPSFVGTYYAMANAYTHMNELEHALDVFENAKNSPYYLTRNWYDKISGQNREITFWKSIDAGEKEIREKIERGYVYRPRKTKK